MNVIQIYTHSHLRNFTYLVGSLRDGYWCIDPFDGKAVVKKLTEVGGQLRGIINTHEHDDHTCGNLELLTLTGCNLVLGHHECAREIPGFSRGLVPKEQVPIDSEHFLEVMDTPGHSRGHLCFKLRDEAKVLAVFSGDILFNAGVGHCRNGGNVEQLYETLAHEFHPLADSILVYPGHEYLSNNLRFSLSLEPNNSAAKSWLARAEANDWYQQNIVTTIGDERLFNPFFRLSSQELINHLPQAFVGDKEVFIALRALRDKW